MNRTEFEKYICDIYKANAEYPWLKLPDFAVYRHTSNNKWFAVVMDIPKSKLGISSQDKISIVNLKCDPIMLGSLLEQNGFFPAYHMNKTHWISVTLDGSVENDTLQWLLEMSYNSTK